MRFSFRKKEARNTEEGWAHLERVSWHYIRVEFARSETDPNSTVTNRDAIETNEIQCTDRGPRPYVESSENAGSAPVRPNASYATTHE